MKTKTLLTITIDEELLKKFRNICKKKGYKVSTKIETLVRDFLEEEHEKD